MGCLGGSRLGFGVAQARDEFLLPRVGITIQLSPRASITFSSLSLDLCGCFSTNLCSCRWNDFHAFVRRTIKSFRPRPTWAAIRYVLPRNASATRTVSKHRISFPDASRIDTLGPGTCSVYLSSLILCPNYSPQ